MLGESKGKAGEARIYTERGLGIGLGMGREMEIDWTGDGRNRDRCTRSCRDSPHRLPPPPPLLYCSNGPPSPPILFLQNATQPTWRFLPSLPASSSAIGAELGMFLERTLLLSSPLLSSGGWLLCRIGSRRIACLFHFPISTNPAASAYIGEDWK